MISQAFLVYNGNCVELRDVLLCRVIGYIRLTPYTNIRTPEFLIILDMA